MTLLRPPVAGSKFFNNYNSYTTLGSKANESTTLFPVEVAVRLEGINEKNLFPETIKFLQFLHRSSVTQIHQTSASRLEPIRRTCRCDSVQNLLNLLRPFDRSNSCAFFQT